MEGQPRAAVPRWLSWALAALCAAAVWAAAADPAALHAQGVTRMLREEADRARAGESSSLGALARSGAARTVRVEVLRDGRGRAPEAVVGAVRGALDDFRRRPPAGKFGPERVDGDGEGVDSLVFDLRVEGPRLHLVASLHEAGGGVRALPSARSWAIPGRGALLPPFVAVTVALLFGRTLLALFLGIWCGATVVALQAGSWFWAPLWGLLDVFRVYFARELTDTFRIEILGFIVALLAMVGVMSRAGGMAGLLDRLTPRVRGPRSAQVATFGSGLVVFFDDISNCMLVGNTLRPLTDRLRVSREKLAYLVDSTAAPVAGLSVLSTWIAFQVSVFESELPGLGIDASGYAVFVQSLPYRFYCWLTLGFVFLVAASGRDFGPMARAERRVRAGGDPVRPGSRSPLADGLARLGPAPQMSRAAHRAAAPIAVTLVATALGIVVRGGGLELVAAPGDGWPSFQSWSGVFMAGSGAGPIFHGALAGLACAIYLAGSTPLRLAAWAGVVGAGAAHASGLGVGGVSLLAFCAAGGLARWRGLGASRPHLSATEIIRASASSGSTLLFASVLLFCAWMIGAVCADVGTADYLVALLSDALRPAWLPLLVFVTAGLVAFSTGSSWSTMAILMPNAVPLAASLGAQTEFGSTLMVVLVIAAVLDGAIFGDHCSPISDTTVMSSIASGCDHLDHVRTQAPYAFLVAGAAVGVGYLPLVLGAGWSTPLALAGGLGLLAAWLFAVGRSAAEPASGSA